MSLWLPHILTIGPRAGFLDDLDRTYLSYLVLTGNFGLVPPLLDRFSFSIKYREKTQGSHGTSSDILIHLPAVIAHHKVFVLNSHTTVPRSKIPPGVCFIKPSINLRMNLQFSLLTSFPVHGTKLFPKCSTIGTWFFRTKLAPDQIPSYTITLWYSTDQKTCVSLQLFLFQRLF